MTELLKKAFEAASKLPPREQDALASVLLEETHEKLTGLADAAMAEHRAGRTQPLDPDTL